MYRSGTDMKHPTSHLLHAYWEKLRGDRAAPERAEIEPGEIRHLLADSLILELDVPARSAIIRLAGTRVCALYGRELRGQPFSALWGDRACDAWRLAETVALDTLGVVAGLRGVNRAEEGVDLELLLLPLRHRAARMSAPSGAELRRGAALARPEARGAGRDDLPAHPGAAQPQRPPARRRAGRGHSPRVDARCAGAAGAPDGPSRRSRLSRSNILTKERQEPCR